MASGNLFFEGDGVADNFGDNNHPEEFWERTQNQLDQLEKDFPDTMNDTAPIGQPGLQLEDDPFLRTNNAHNIPNGNDDQDNTGDINIAGLNLGDNISQTNNSHTNSNHKNYEDTISNASGSVKSGDYSAIRKIDKVYQEPESIRIWREKQQETIKAKDLEEEVKRKEMKEQAKKELEEWENMHKQQMAKARENNRKHEKEFQQANKDDAEKALEKSSKLQQPTGVGRDIKAWEKVASLCDFNPKNNRHLKDVSRLRSVIVKLKSPAGTSKAATTTTKSEKILDPKNQNLPNGNIYDEEDYDE